MVKKVGKKVVTTSSGAKGGSKQGKSPLFEKNARNFRIGGDIQPKRDLTRFVKWPKYIRIQRQKRILLQRLKVPPTLNQFSKTIDKNQASQLLKLLAKYKPETHKEKKARLQTEAEAKKNGADAKKSAKPVVIKFGLNHVTNLVEEGKAKIVVIAHDVDPLEIMAFLPALCRKKGIPFCFIKGKARLGKLVHQKTATCVALTEVRKEDFQDLEVLAKNFRAQFNENETLRRNWGGGVMGIKNQHMMAQREKLKEIELAKKANM
jgi:large subunit ribosomal protein L7Ae